MTIQQLEEQVQGILAHDNPDAEFKLSYGHNESIIFVDGSSQEFIMHSDDLERIEMTLGMTFRGICFVKSGFSMSFIAKD